MHANRSGEPVHLLSAFDHVSGPALAQTDVDGKTNEITRFQRLLRRTGLPSWRSGGRDGASRAARTTRRR